MGSVRINQALVVTPGVIAPPWFQHSTTPGKPTPPDYSTLDAEDQQRYQLWKTNRDNNTLLGNETINASAALQAAFVAYENYLSTSAYQAWFHADRASREAQWRLQLVDTLTAVDAANTKPPSFDSAGVGTAAPGVGDIGGIGGPPAGGAPEYVVTGDPASPEFVFGDNGDIVTVS